MSSLEKYNKGFQPKTKEELIEILDKFDTLCRCTIENITKYSDFLEKS